MAGRHDRAPNPRAIAAAPRPRVALVPANGTTLYAEVRGAGQAVLLIPGGAEDAEGWQAVAERLPDCQVITYDRRGTARSGRADWPGAGSEQHADDAASLLDGLGVDRATVMGGSTGGIIAVELALRHPSLVRAALVFEPGYFANAPGGSSFREDIERAVARQLEAHPADWLGAYRTFGRAVTSGQDPGAATAFATAAGPAAWYAEREESNAEPFVRDDLPILSREALDERRLSEASADIRFAYGMDSLPVFRDIVTHLASVHGSAPEAVEGVGHSLYLWPEEAAAWIAAAIA